MKLKAFIHLWCFSFLTHRVASYGIGSKSCLRLPSYCKIFSKCLNILAEIHHTNLLECSECWIQNDFELGKSFLKNAVSPKKGSFNWIASPVDLYDRTNI